MKCCYRDKNVLELTSAERSFHYLDFFFMCSARHLERHDLENNMRMLVMLNRRSQPC